MNTEEPDGVAVGGIIEAVDDADRRSVRDTLEPVIDDGAVTGDSVKAAVSDTSKLLATAETRIELAGDAYDDATAAADPIADIPTVGARLDTFHERLSGVESMIPELRPDLSVPADVRRRPVAAYELAVEIRDAVATAQEAIEAADDLSFDVEEFESWLDRPDRRYDAFEEDLELVADTADDLAAVIDERSDASDPAIRWADATMRSCVLSLLITDLRAELADLRTLAERVDDPFRAGLSGRLARAEERVLGLESALDSRADGSWHDRFGDDIAAFEASLAAVDPPVDWGAVDRTLAEHRPVVTDETR